MVPASMYGPQLSASIPRLCVSYGLAQITTAGAGSAFAVDQFVLFVVTHIYTEANVRTAFQSNSLVAADFFTLSANIP